MQNSNAISFQKGVDELKQMFPNFEEDIIISVLLENDKTFEKAVDVLLAMHVDDNKIDKGEPEISIFSKNPSIVDYSSYVNKENIPTTQNKVIQSSKKETIISEREDRNKSNNVNVNRYEKNSIDDTIVKKKSSFGQKFKSN